MPELQSPETTSPPLWDVFRGRFEATGKLVAATGLRVGAGGESVEPTASDLPILTDRDGQPYIPGSSLRGVLRSHIERVVRVLEPGPGRDGRGACNPLEEAAWCIPNAAPREWLAAWRRGHDNQPPSDAERAAWIWGQSCRVCRVFGSTWLASRVRVADLPCDTAAVVIERRDGVSIDRDKETVKNKYDFEALPAGVAFRLSVLADNLTDAELGLLWLGLGELEQGHLHLGGFKGRGLGRVTVSGWELKRLDATDRRALLDYLRHRQLPVVQSGAAERWLTTLLEEVA